MSVAKLLLSVRLRACILHIRIGRFCQFWNDDLRVMMFFIHYKGAAERFVFAKGLLTNIGVLGNLTLSIINQTLTTTKISGSSRGTKMKQ